MIKLTEITRGEFRDREKDYDVVIGEKESCSQFYELICKYGNNSLSIALIHNYSNMGLVPQLEIVGNKLIVGNNESLSIINLTNKEIKEYPIFPLFNKFFLYQDLIIVMSELVVFCISRDKIIWSLNDFGGMIFFERLEDNKLVVSTYEDRKEISIDINTGEII